MEYKDTLLMPKTNFPMRGGLANKEPQIQKEWEEKNIYTKILEKNLGNKHFILHDGPPYANGSLHIGHALNKILKDFIIRSKSMQGFYTPYIPGWDTHGLPIEQALVKKGVNRKSLSIADFRKKCEIFAKDQISHQKKDFKRLGVNGDWDNAYVTLNPEFEASQIRLFGEMAEKGLIYKGKKPVYWSPSSESSLAEAEIEYQDKTSPSIYVKFNVSDGKGIVDQDASFIIWTTTPWTIPANVAIAVNPSLNYAQINVNNNKYIVAEALLDRVSDELEWNKNDIVKEKEFVGSDLEYITAQHPFINRTSLVILGDHVTTDTGTGCVHTAPGHGEDDYIVGKKYGLDVISPIDDKGVLTEEAGEFEGLFYDKANKSITDKLNDTGSLLKLSFLKHSYPHDWRTKKPVIFRATAQWFASIDKVRDEILESIENINFKVDWGKQRLYNMIRDRGEWVISRQRVWGVPLPIFYAENGEPIMNRTTINHIADLFEKYGSNIWFEKSANELLPEGFKHEGSPNNKFTKETDIMDVWFDSGSSHRAVLENRPNLSFPADLYFEGSDQYRGWFNSSITTSVSTRGIAPYKTLLSHGFFMDGKGRKMSKSLNNIIQPKEIVDNQGADILRLWVSSVDYTADMRISDDILKQVSDVYRKIRNTYKFILGNLNDFNPQQNQIQEKNLLEPDYYMINKLKDFTNHTLKHYDNYEYINIYQELQNFINTELSNFYLDYGKDILYIENVDSFKRRSMQTVLYKVIITLTKLLAPILPHTSEEAWSYIPYNTKDSVHLSDMPKPTNIDYNIIEKWETFMNIRDNVNRALENARNNKIIGKSLEAKVIISNSKNFNTIEFLSSFDNLQQLFIVSQVEFSNDQTENEQFEYSTVSVVKADGEKCKRCWNYSKEINIHDESNDICPRCKNVLKNNGGV